MIAAPEPKIAETGSLRQISSRTGGWSENE
jgi:hypothetical protein